MKIYVRMMCADAKACFGNVLQNEVQEGTTVGEIAEQKFLELDLDFQEDDPILSTIFILNKKSVEKTHILQNEDELTICRIVSGG